MGRLDFFERYRTGEGVKPAVDISSLNKKNIERIAKELGGRVISRGSSGIILVEKIIPLETMYGGVRIQDIKGIDESFLKSLFYNAYNELYLDFSRKINPDDLLFMDVETTGLSAGAGTIVFLIGLADLTEDGLRLRQYFLPSFSAEWLFIGEIKNVLFSKRFLVTYNGKGFDFHIIKNRFVMQGYPFEEGFHLHFDLLYPSRRFWKGLLEEYSLGTVEKRILGVNRHGDVRGSEVPVLYFKYLDSADIRPIKRIVYHNRMDVCTLVALLIRMKEVIESCTSENVGRRNIIFNTGSVAGHFQKCGMLQKARKILELYSTSPDDLFKLGTIYKKEGFFHEAISAFSSCIKGVKDTGLFISGCVEMAKIYEHRYKDYQKALMYTEKAILRLERNKLFYPKKQLLLSKVDEELKRRKRRLLRKINR